MKVWLLTFLFVLTSLTAVAQPAIRPLDAELDAGKVQFEGLSGNGSSSGFAIEGDLVNTTKTTIRIAVNLARPMFLVNWGRGQNMVATAIYLQGGRYMKLGRHSFIELRPRQRVQVTLVAYCADFERENPTSSDQFVVGRMPEDISGVMARVHAYARANPDRDVTSAAQAAVWLARGVDIRDIRARFSVTAEDERLARSWLP